MRSGIIAPGITERLQGFGQIRGRYPTDLAHVHQQAEYAVVILLGPFDGDDAPA